MERFEEASFGESRHVITPDFMRVYQMLNVQCKINNIPCDNLFSNDVTYESIAEEFGEFMKKEFLKAMLNKQHRMTKEWEDGEKVTRLTKDGKEITSLKEQSQPVYSQIKGEFTPIG